MKILQCVLTLLAPTTGLLAQGPIVQARAAEERPTLQQKVTFAEQVAPIVFQKCAFCHRAGDIAPFPLTSSKQACVFRHGQ